MAYPPFFSVSLTLKRKQPVQHFEHFGQFFALHAVGHLQRLLEHKLKFLLNISSREVTQHVVDGYQGAFTCFVFVSIAIVVVVLNYLTKFGQTF